MLEIPKWSRMVPKYSQIALASPKGSVIPVGIYSNPQIRVPRGSKNAKIVKIEVCLTSSPPKLYLTNAP